MFYLLSINVFQALAFFSKYATSRADSLDQEVQYNMGRMFHQMGILPNAIKCYERVLYECPTPLVWVEDPDGYMPPRPEPTERYIFIYFYRTDMDLIIILI